MKRTNKNLKSGMSLAVMLGSMAVIASVFGYFVCSWFLDYVTAPEDGIKSVVNEQVVSNDQIVTEEKIDSNDNGSTTKQNEALSTTEKIEKEEEEAEDTVMTPNLDQDLYVVQVGAFSKQSNAQGLVEQLQNKGFTAYITSKDPYRVQVGAFRTKDAAEELSSELKNYGFPIYIKHQILNPQLTVGLINLYIKIIDQFLRILKFKFEIKNEFSNILDLFFLNLHKRFNINVIDDIIILVLLLYGLYLIE